jgi:hypothetical protein
LLAKSGATPAPGTPAQFTEVLRQEVADVTEFFQSPEAQQQQ